MTVRRSKRRGIISLMTATPADTVKDECYRCGYDLRGIVNDGACPECGLLAVRSRRVTDELHDTRPRWLRSISRGINLILLAIGAIFAGPILATILMEMLPFWWNVYLPLVGFDFAAICLALGVILVTRPEGYAPADRADQRLRRLLRITALTPLLMLGLATATALNRPILPDQSIMAAIYVFLIVFAFAPLLLFLHLRGLAKRVRSAHLAEHCIIVGVGAFVSTLYIDAIVFVLNNENRLGINSRWQWQSSSGFLAMLLLSVAFCLFILWSLYLLVRFAVAFWIAAHKLRDKWTRDDRSLTT